MPGTKRYEFVGWGITEACNLSCPHCYSKATKSRRNDSPCAECLPILDWLGDVGASTVGWTGGEPLLRRDLEDPIRYADDRKVPVLAELQRLRARNLRGEEVNP